jgi:hypothetical protein
VIRKVNHPLQRLRAQLEQNRDDIKYRRRRNQNVVPSWWVTYTCFLPSWKWGGQPLAGYQRGNPLLFGFVVRSTPNRRREYRFGETF